MICEAKRRFKSFSNSNPSDRHARLVFEIKIPQNILYTANLFWCAYFVQPPNFLNMTSETENTIKKEIVSTSAIIINRRQFNQPKGVTYGDMHKKICQCVHD